VTTVRQDGVNLVRVARTDRGVPGGFEPDQPIPGGTGVSTTVRLTWILATDVCRDVQVYGHRL
jgi:hypothetical protein